MSIIRLYHMGFQVIDKPDIRIGRANADFGQGFYLSDDEEFSRRWAKDIKGKTNYLNIYELDTGELKIRTFERDPEWFGYINSNRRGRPDPLADHDVIIGPIANDTIYDVMGITTSGFITDEQALEVLKIGLVYHQIVIKTERALEKLRFIKAVEITPDEIADYRETVRLEEENFQREFARILSDDDQ